MAHFCLLMYSFALIGEIYVSAKEGSDEDGDGTMEKPFKTALKVNFSGVGLMWLIYSI